MNKAYSFKKLRVNQRINYKLAIKAGFVVSLIMTEVFIIDKINIVKLNIVKLKIIKNKDLLNLRVHFLIFRIQLIERV